MKTFEELGIAMPIRKAIEELGYAQPMSVQEEVIPLLLDQTRDIIALAQTGTGKTAAFGIPVIQKIDITNRAPQTLILCPTRELCLQISSDLTDYSAYIEDISDIHRTEPYVYSQMIAGKDAPTFGEGKNSWLTGTAAWTFMNVSQYILGIRPTLQGLSIDPCLPSSIKGFSCERVYRGVQYHISVEKPDGVSKGVRSIVVDGKMIDGNVIPFIQGAVECRVEVVKIGRASCRERV